MADKDIILEVRDLKKYFKSPTGTLHAVDGVNFSIRRGETLGLVGESGCGKSITSLTIMGLLDPKAKVSGEILYDGQNLLNMDQKQMNALRGREIAMIYQDALSSLNPSMLIKAQMKQLTKRGGTRTAEELLELVEMEVRELLDFYGFPGDDTPIIRGSALNALVSESTDPNAPEYACIKELMDAVDEWIPTPDRKEDMPFLMPVEDVFTISGRGTVATGRVERGQLKLNEKVEIVGLSDEKRETVVTGIEMFHKLLDYAEAGDNIGALLRGVAKTEIERGQVLSKPGSIHPHTKFVGQVYVLTKDEGGRHTPFFNNYRPQFYFRTTDVTGVITLPEGTEMCMPGDNVEMSVELITPIAIEKGLRFAIREGGRTVGSGAVTEITEA